jgi:energy-coupling factor transport system permease protein
MKKQFVINITPKDTYLHKLTGKTKVLVFISLIFYTLMSFDVRLLLPLFILCVFALISIKPSWKVVFGLFTFIFIMNFINLVIYWLVDPDIGNYYTTSTPTILLRLSDFYYFSSQTLWYLSIRHLKLMTSFMVSLVFIMTITPSEFAAGLYGLGLPYKVCTVVSLAFRYIPDLSNDFENIKISLQARGLEMDKRRLNIFKRLKDNLYILLPLIISSFDRIGNIANALDLRAYGLLKTRTYYCEHEPTKADKLFRWISYFVILFCFSWIISRIIWKPETRMWYPFGV